MALSPIEQAKRDKMRKLTPQPVPKKNETGIIGKVSSAISAAANAVKPYVAPVAKAAVVGIPAALGSAIASRVVSAKPAVVAPAPAKPVVAPAPAKPVVAPAPAKPVVAPAPAKPVVAPAPAKAPALPAKAPVINNSVATPTASFSTGSAPTAPATYVPKNWSLNGKTDVSSFQSDMRSNLTPEEIASFKAKASAAGSDKVKQAEVFSEMKDAVNAKLKTKFESANVAAPASQQAATFQNVANLTDPEKLAQGRQGAYASKNEEFARAQKSAYDDLAGINDQYKATVLRSLGIKADGTPDLSNTEGQYAKSKKMYDDLVTNNQEAFKTIRTQVEADLGGAGKQLLIQAGLSGSEMDPAALGLKMGAAGQRALGLVNDAKNVMLKNESAILQQKNAELAKLVSDGILSAEAYDKAKAAAKAQYDSNVYDNSLRLLEAAFGQQEVANAYDAQNRKERVNAIDAALGNLGLSAAQKGEMLSSFNFRRDANGQLETPERALLRLSEWTKQDVNSINPQFRPKPGEEFESWKKFRTYISTAEQATKAKAAFDRQIELLKAQKSGSGSSGSTIKLPPLNTTKLLAAVGDGVTQLNGSAIVAELAAANKEGRDAVLQLEGKTKTIPSGKVYETLAVYDEGLAASTKS